MLLWARCAIVLLPACFNPVYGNRLACDSHGECPGGFRCSAQLICESNSSANLRDAGPNAAPVCFGTLLSICFPASAVPTQPRPLVNGAIDTDMTMSGTACDQNNDHKDAYCVVAGAGVTLPAGATVSAQGKKPLVLLSTADMTLAGTIDVSSTAQAPRL